MKTMVHDTRRARADTLVGSQQHPVLAVFTERHARDGKHRNCYNDVS